MCSFQAVSEYEYPLRPGSERKIKPEAKLRHLDPAELQLH